MNEYAAKLAIKETVVNNLDTLLDGLRAQGALREMTVTTSIFTPVIDYYWCTIRSDGVRDSQKHRNVHGVYRGNYSMVVELSDVAFPQYGESEAYEEMDNQFRLMCDRVATLIESTDRFCVTIDGTESCFKLVNDGNSPVVIKSNLDDIAFDAEGTIVGLILASIIRFSIEDC